MRQELGEGSKGEVEEWDTWREGYIWERREKKREKGRGGRLSKVQ